jgi:PAS domain S-box-containing protein
MPAFLYSLRIRLLLLVIVAIIPALGLLFYTTSLERRKQEAEIRVDTMRMASSVANYLEQLVEGARQVLTVVSGLPAVQNQEASACNAYFSDFKKQLPMYNNLAAIALNGDIYCSANPIKRKTNVSDRLYFQTAAQKKVHVYGEYNIARTNNKPAIASALPVMDKKRQVTGVVFVSLGLDWFKEHLSKVQIPEKATLTVVDRYGTVLYHHPDSEKWIGKNVSALGFDWIISAQEEGMVEATELDGIKRIYAFTPIKNTDKGLFVRVGISPMVAFADINLMLLKNLLTLLLIACIAYAVAWFGGEYFIVRRMKELMRATEELSKGNLSARVEVDGRQDEIGKLAGSFNKMAEALGRHIEERRKSEEQYRILFEKSKDMIFVSTPQGKYLDINPAAQELLGYSSKEEMLQLDINTDIFANPEDRKVYQQVLTEKGFVKDYELEFKRKDGEILTVLSTTSTLRNDKGDIVVYMGIDRDITERKKLEQQLLQAQKMEAVGQLSGGIAHDFNNILTAILGYGNLLNKKLPAADPLHNYLDQILISAQKAANLTKSLLVFSRKQVLNPVPVDINDIVMGMKNILERVIGEDIEFKVTTIGHDLIVKADKGQIEQVLMNLATNSRDAMPHGGKLTITTAEVKIDEKFVRIHQYGIVGKYAVILVADTGVGIDKIIQKRVFEPFFSTKDVGKGTGLGLAMVYGTIKQHDGFINVYSELGIGTTFKIYLPLTRSHEQQDQKQTTTGISRGSETILLVEDDEAVRNVIRTMLEELGYKVIEADNGKHAIENYRENRSRIRLVITDMIMPGLSGKEVHYELKKIQPDVKIIYMSGYTADILKQKGMENEKINFISKPVQHETLARKIRDVLGEV